MILIIDDDKAIHASLSLLMKQAGHTAVCASNPKEALHLINQQVPSLILLDMNFGNDTSGKEGLSFLSEIKDIAAKVPVILITAWGTIPLAVEGIKNGAFDFVNKPWDNENLLQIVNTAFELKKQTNGIKTSNRKELDKKYNFSNIIGNSPQLVSILETIGRVGKTDAPVLILGESGTGKELIAEAIHNNSNRKDKPFVKVNLGGISSSLFESELFGHKKGAFTDAYNDRKGRFEIAGSGTIFLDEIGDLDFSSQVKLLRVLQDKTYQVLGDNNTKRADVRVICATNRDLKQMVEKGTFREDLFYRINLITIQLPQLRERQEDIPYLANYFIKNIIKVYQLSNLVISPKALKWLKEMPFPGNIRELKNLVERAYLMSGKEVLENKDFENTFEHAPSIESKSGLPAVGSMTLEEMEHQMIIKAMKTFPNNLSKVAKSLGLSRGALYRRLEKYGIEYNEDL